MAGKEMAGLWLEIRLQHCRQDYNKLQIAMNHTYSRRYPIPVRYERIDSCTQYTASSPTICHTLGVCFLVINDSGRK